MKVTLLVLIMGLMTCYDLQAQKPEAIISKASTAPVIDGIIDEVWNEAYPGNSIAVPFGTENPTLGNPGDTYWRALWTGEEGNPEDLFLLVVIADDDFYPAYAAGGSPWMYDSPEFFIDVNTELEDGLGPSTEGSGHYIKGISIVEGNTGGEVVTDLSGMSYAVMVNEPAYLVEYHIPLSMFKTSEGYEPDYGQAIGFDLVINDNDRATENRDRASWSNDGGVAENYLNMDDAGRVYFEGALRDVLIESLSLETGAIIDTDNGKLILDYTFSPIVANEEDLLWSVTNGTGRARIDKSTGEITALVDGTVWVRLAGRNAVDSCELSISNQFVTRSDISYIRNGTFDEVNEDGTAREWDGPSKVVDGTLFLENPGDPAGDIWDCEISQEDMGCNNSDQYILSFDLSASAPGEVHVLFQDLNNNYFSYGVSDHEFASPLGRSAWEFTSTTETVRYSLDVQFDQLLPTTEELFAFMLGRHSGDVTIDNVELIFTADLELLSPEPIPDYPVRITAGRVALYNFNGDFLADGRKLPTGSPVQLEWAGDRFCQSEKSFRLSGQNSYLGIADHDSLDLAGEFTLSFWLNPDAGLSEETMILYKGDPQDQAAASYWVSVYPGSDDVSGNAWSFSYRDEIEGVRTILSDSGMLAGEWMCYTISYDGDSLMLFGGAERLAAFESSLTIANTDDTLYLGNPVNQVYSGLFDQLAIYNRALSPEEIAGYFRQNADLQVEELTSIDVCPGSIVKLVSPAAGPFMNYTFTRDGEVIQEGSDSTCLVEIVSTLDLGRYSCVAENCFDTLTVYFDLEFSCDPGPLKILDQSRLVQLYPRGHDHLVLEMEGASSSTSYQWIQNGVLTDYDQYYISLTHMSAADTGLYVCEIRDGNSVLISDPIHVVMLDSLSRPMADTLGLRAWYTFDGDYLDRTGFTGPGIAQGLEQDSGIYKEVNESSLFQGFPSYLEVPADKDLDMEGSFTMILMLRLDQAGSGKEPIVVKSSSDDGSPGSYALYLDQDKHLQFSVTAGDGTDYTLVSDSVMEEGTWYMIHATYDGSQLNLYMNYMKSLPVDIPQDSLKASDGPLIIGSTESSDVRFLLDDFRLYNRAMDADEVEDNFELHSPHYTFGHIYEVCVGDTVDLDIYITGPYVNYDFYREGILIQSGPSHLLKVPITSEDDLGSYQCIAGNGFYTLNTGQELKSGKLYDDLYLYYSNEPEIYASPGDVVSLRFYVNNNYEGLEYFLYHNDEMIPDAFRGIWTIESVDYEDAGDYYFVVMNGCERMVSDTVYLYIDGGEFVDFEVPGWDWTGNVSGSGNSYFSSIGLAADGSFGLLGYFSGGLRVEGEEVFSSVSDDIFLTVYNANGEHRWSRFIKSPFFKGKADLTFDSEGNLYVCGSFTDEVAMFGDTLTDADNSRGFLAKLNSEGELDWLKSIQSTRLLECSHVKIDAQDRIYLGGNFSGSMSIDDQDVTGDWDEYSNVMFLASLDASGSCQWIRHAVTCDMDFFGLVDMELTTEGEPVVCGTYMSEADFGNGVVLSTPVEGPFLVKYDALGTPQWGTTISTMSGFAEAFDVSVDDLDRIFMTGMHVGDVAFGEHEAKVEGDVMGEIFLARFDDSGNCTVLSSYGSEGDGSDYGICYEPDSDTAGYLLGMYGDTIIMGNDRLEAVVNTQSGLISSNMFVARLKDDGEVLAMRSAGVKSNGFYGEIATVSDGRLIFAGLNSFDAIQKSSQAQGQSIAFAGFKENGLLNSTVVEKVEQLTICEGDSVLFHGQWCSSGGEYEYVKAGVIGADTLIILKLSTEVCTGVEGGSAEDNIRVYPNPASTVLYIESGDARAFGMTLYDLNGRLLTRKNGKTHYELSVDEYAPGLHLLVLNLDGKVVLKRIMID